MRNGRAPSDFASRRQVSYTESNLLLWRAQFVPNTTRNDGYPGYARVLFPLQVGKAASQRLLNLAFQAGYASSILVARSTALPLAREISAS